MSVPATSTAIQTGSRSESVAYPKNHTSGILSRVQLHLRQNTRAVGASVAFVMFVLILSTGSAAGSTGGLRGGSSGVSHSAYNVAFAGAQHDGYFSVGSSSIVKDGKVTGYRFGFITDLDELSRIKKPDSIKLKFQSHLALGVLNINQESSRYLYNISFDPVEGRDDGARQLITGHNEASRGAEFSELVVYDGRLLTMDDRTGDVFEILNHAEGKDSFCVPRLVITEGEGDTDKGMKWEWATVKNGLLYMGSMGKEYTDRDGNIVNTNNLWIAVVDRSGQIRREDWTKFYSVVRKALGATAPGYVIIEAITWSPVMKKWVVLPRRISSEKYDDVQDERRGGRKLVYVSESYDTDVVDLEVESTDPLKGFSSFKFVPGTNDEHILALRSIEEDCADDEGECKQRSFVVAINAKTGKQLSKEVRFPQDWKFEGVEFFDPYVRP